MFDFIGFCRAKSIPYLTEGHPKCSAGWAQTHCPFCSLNKGFHLGFNLQRGNFNCWRCGPLKRFDVVSRLLGTTDPRVTIEALRGHKTKAPMVERQKEIMRKKSLEPPVGCGPLQKVHKRYLRRRGFDWKVLVEEWGVMGTTDYSGNWNWRIVFPLNDPDGRTVAYQGRSINGEEPKYRLTKNEDCLVDPKTIVYGLDKVPGKTLIIVEGATDVWRLGPGAVATLGISWDSSQADQLRKYEKRFIVMDPGRQAQKRALKLANWLGMFPGETSIIDGLGKDPGSMTDAEAAALLALIES